MQDLIVVAHRGGKCPHPENTLEAFAHGFKNGVKAVEMDLRFNYWMDCFFVEHDFLHRSKKRQNLLDNIVPALPKELFVFAELKTLSCFSNYVAKKFLRSFERLFDPSRTVVMSFNPFILMRLKKLAPKMQVGMLCGKRFWHTLFQKLLYKYIKPAVYLLHYRLLNEKNVRFGRDRGMQVFSFVLNKEAQWRRALALEVDGIVTDFPIDLQDFISKNRCQQPTV